ncbi:hypothetical protein [Asanoa sp. NPDC050611]|uniref:hypothetical protein n=1 Tax=Asanoa sp. NPDC050611 TaxID=3157098 RepID=UPI0033D6D604
MRSRLAAVAALVVAVGLTGACAGVEGGGVSSSEPSSVAPSGRSLSPIPPPTLPPTKVGPSEPSDYIAGDTIGGRVVKGGSGPCYAVVNDDNQRFALHNDSGLTLEEGTYITAKVAPLRAKIDCGEGIPYALVSFKRL